MPQTEFLSHKMPTVKLVSGCKPSHKAELSHKNQRWGRGLKGKEVIHWEINHRVLSVLPHLSREEDVKELITIKESTEETEEPSGSLCSLFITLAVQSHTALPSTACSEEPAPPRTARALPASVCMASLLAARESRLGGLPFPAAGGLQAGAHLRDGQEPFLWPW